MNIKKNISIIIPAKNEEQSLPLMLRELPIDIIKEIIIVDGHSNDQTIDVVEKLQIQEVQIIQQTGKGYGNAINEGTKKVTGDFIVFMDADGSYNPKSLVEIMTKIETHSLDVCFCSRYLLGAGSDDDTMIRYIGNKIFSFLLKYVHGVKISDALFLYCMVRRNALERLKMTSNGFSFCVEFPIRVHNIGLKYTEIPSFERKRFAGKSKVNAFVDGFLIAMTIFKLKLTIIWSMVQQRRQ